MLLEPSAAALLEPNIVGQSLHRVMCLLFPALAVLVGLQFDKFVLVVDGFEQVPLNFAPIVTHLWIQVLGAIDFRNRRRLVVDRRVTVPLDQVITVGRPVQPTKQFIVKMAETRFSRNVRPLWQFTQWLQDFNTSHVNSAYSDKFRNEFTCCDLEIWELLVLIVPLGHFNFCIRITSEIREIFHPCFFAGYRIEFWHEYEIKLNK